MSLERDTKNYYSIIQGANIKLSGTVSEIDGKSSRNILNVILSGEKFDRAKYDEMLSKKEIARNLKANAEQLIDDMNGVLSKMQRRVLKELLKHLDELAGHISNLNEEINNFMNPDEKKCVEDMKAIPGIGNDSAQAIISVIGTDMGRFPTDKHISKWAGLCPGNNESAKKRKSGRTTKGNAVLRTTLVLFAHSAVKVKDSYFSAQFTRISAHRGKKRVYVAVAHSMLIAIYHVIKEQVPYHDLGSNYYNQFNIEKKKNALIKKLIALGFQATVVPA